MPLKTNFSSFDFDDENEQVSNDFISCVFLRVIVRDVRDRIFLRFEIKLHDFDFDVRLFLSNDRKEETQLNRQVFDTI